ncbi:MAG: hypothetical protein MJA29_08445, partial [Candidatus Omnitrophica bacterium]|nr:hypothetical protein [Candidatus Omnitrophota bacterium]
MKRFLTMALVLMFAIPVAADIGNPPPNYCDATKCRKECVRDLIAAQHFNVGYVKVHWENDHVKVEYVIEDTQWQLKEVHFGWFGDDLPPHAVPGQMQYGFEGLSGHYFTFNIPIDQLCEDDDDDKATTKDLRIRRPGRITGDDDDGGCVCNFAAHAVVTRDGECEKSRAKTIFVERNYPDAGLMKATRQGRTSYFNVWIKSDAQLNGHVFNGWCLDARKKLDEGRWYDVEIIYDWSQVTDDIVKFPENLKYIEWITEQNYVGNVIRCGAIVQRDHVQNAIWHLA